MARLHAQVHFHAFFCDKCVLLRLSCVKPTHRDREDLYFWDIFVRFGSMRCFRTLFHSCPSKCPSDGGDWSCGQIDWCRKGTFPRLTQTSFLVVGYFLASSIFRSLIWIVFKNARTNVFLLSASNNTLLHFVTIKFMRCA